MTCYEFETIAEELRVKNSLIFRLNKKKSVLTNKISK